MQKIIYNLNMINMLNNSHIYLTNNKQAYDYDLFYLLGNKYIF